MATRLSFPSLWRLVPSYAEWILEALPPWARTDEVRFGVSEALSNAIVHGALRVPARRDGGTGLAEHLDAVDQAPASLAFIDVVVHPDGPSISIRDPGVGFDWRQIPAQRGHGLAVLRTVFERVRWNERGNEVRLVVGRKDGGRDR
jgi:anti-sigma regulatory factor (Ser/Thr protein kinase)